MFCVECGTECEDVGVVPTMYIGEPFIKYVCPKCGWSNTSVPTVNIDAAVYKSALPNKHR